MGSPMGAGIAVRIAAMIAALALPVRVVAAQSTCSVPAMSSGQTAGCTATLTATMTIVPVAQLTLTSVSTSISGSTSGVLANSYDAGATAGIVVTGPAFTVRSNKGVNVTLVNAPTFTSPTSKTAADVDISFASGSGSCGTSWSTLSTQPLAAQQASPRSLLNLATGSAGITGQLCFRVRWKWAVDGPGSYSLPLTISVTAP